jgi:hypothetical protein
MAITAVSQDFIIKNGLVINNTATFLSNAISTGTNTGALIVSGGIGAAGNLNIGNNFNLGGTSTIAGDLIVQGVNLLAYDEEAIYVSESTGDDLTGDGRRIQSAYRTVKKALSEATTGTIVILDSGTYQEEFPLTLPTGVTVRGAGLRSTTITPTGDTNTSTCFLLNGECLVSDLTVSGFYKPGFAFRFADNAKITTRSPYIERVSVITRGSIVSSSDPYGFDAGDAGGGAYLDASILDRDSLEPAMLWNECTFIVPNATGWYMTNGARAEILNGFTYFADKSIHAVSSSTGYGGDGKTRLRLDGIQGTFTPGDTLYYKSILGETLASGVIESTLTGGYIIIDGPAYGFEEITNRAGKNVFAYNGAIQSTADKKFGTSSYKGNGTNSYLQSPQSNDFGFGTGDFAIECFIKRLSTATNQYITDFRITDNQVSPAIYISNTGSLIYFVSGEEKINALDAVPSTSTWYHVALSRNGDDHKMFVDGVQVGSTWTTSTATTSYVTNPITIGARYNGAESFDGYIDEFRLSKGIARFTSNFTAPTEPYVSDDLTVLLLHFDSGNNSTTFLDDALGQQDVFSLGSAFTGTAARIILADYHQFGADVRCIGSAAVFGNYGIIADGTGTTLQLIAFNVSHIGAGKDLSNDQSLTVQANEIVQTNNGNVYFQTVDQNGDFRVGSSFLINQRTGNVLFGDASVALSNLESLTITDGVDNVIINPANLQVGNLNFSENLISSISGNISISPANNLTLINGNLIVSGTITGDVTGVITTATNVGGGAPGSIPYQSDTGTTAMLSIGVNKSILVSDGSVPSWSSSPTIGGNVTIEGNLTVQGTTTLIDSTVTNISDPIFVIGSGPGGVPPTTDDGKDRGIAFDWHNGTNTRVGFFGFDRSTGFFTFITSASIVNEVVSPDGGTTRGAIDANLSGGTAGQLVYQSAPNTTNFVGPGNAGEILVSDGANAPVYTSTSTIQTGFAANLLGGAAGEFAYQTGPNATAFVNTASMYVYRAVVSDSAAGTSDKANNLNGGTAGQIPYQSAPDTTLFFGPGNAGEILVSAGASAPVYTNTSSIYVNSSVNAETLYGGSAGQLVYQTSPGSTGFVTTASTGQLLISGGFNQPQYQSTLTVDASVVNVNSTVQSLSTTTGALQVDGGVGVGDSVYVGNRVGFVNTSNISVVYQVYNPETNSLDTVFA